MTSVSAYKFSSALLQVAPPEPASKDCYYFYEDPTCRGPTLQEPSHDSDKHFVNPGGQAVAVFSDGISSGSPLKGSQEPQCI